MVTAYQLACGQFEEIKLYHGKVEIYKEHNCYHVRRFSYFIDGLRTIQESWLVFDTLKDARKAFRRQVSILKGVD